MKKLVKLFLLISTFSIFSCVTEESYFLNDNGGEPVEPSPCQVAIQAVQTAQTALVSATTENYSELCNTFKTALQTQIQECGDTNGLIASLLEALGDCAQQQAACTNSLLEVYTAQNNLANATNDNYTELCNELKTIVQEHIAECGDDNQTFQTIINALGNCTPVNNQTCEQLQEILTVAQQVYQANQNAVTCAAYKEALENYIAACEDENGTYQQQLNALGDCN